MSPIVSQANLARWLASQKIDVSGWGKANAKSVADLWQEVRNGETLLACNPPRRYVRAVKIYLFQADAILMETAQILRDGRLRYRWRPPSEKLYKGESYTNGALRCLQEELNLTQDIVLHPETHKIEQMFIESPSYPNLQTCYEFHQITATVTNLPTHNFCTITQVAVDKDAVKAHEWGWYTR